MSTSANFLLTTSCMKLWWKAKQFRCTVDQLVGAEVSGLAGYSEVRESCKDLNRPQSLAPDRDVTELEGSKFPCKAC